MSDYRIYLLDSAGEAFLRYDFQGPGDLAAFEESKKYSEKQNVEIWQGVRQVARIDEEGHALIGPRAGYLVREVFG